MNFTRSLSLGLLAGALSACAQTYTAKQIHFSQLGSFTQQQLEDAVGLPVGRSFNKTDLGAAAKRLVDTGYFDDVEATLDGQVTAVTVKFIIKPTDRTHLLHVGFENFIWLTHDEIDAAIKTRFPLFINYLPENSSHLDDIKLALVQALAAKSITAEIQYDTFEPTLRHPLREVGFSVVTPLIQVGNVKLGGVTRALVPLVQKSVNSTVRTRYTEGPSNETTADRILAPLLDAGYIEASLTQAVITDIQPAPSPAAKGEVIVTLSAILHAGEIFHLSEIAFPGTEIFTTAAFASLAKLHPGDLASHSAMLATLAPIDTAYRTKGYMDVVVDAVPTLDANAHTVAYMVHVQPGDPYRVHELTANGLGTEARADFDRGFLMKAGQLYNPEYASGFLKNNRGLHGLDGYAAAFKAYADPNTHTVDLVMTFAKM